MRQFAKVVSVVAVAACAAAAQAGGGPPPMGGPGQGGPPPMGGGMHHPPMNGGPQQGGPGGPQQGGPKAPDARGAAMLLVIAADADQSRDVTADEWAAFVASLGADENGVVSIDALAAVLPLPPAPPGAVVDTTRQSEMLTRGFDRDGDGLVTLSDLNALFGLLDADGDGALSSEELAPPAGGPGGHQGPPPGGDHPGGCQSGDPHRAGFLLARAADADDDKSVSSDEWSAFLASLGADENGVVSLDALAAALPAPPNAPDDGGDTTYRDEALTRGFDYDGDGLVEVSDLQAIFDELDKNDDGAAAKAEVKRPKPLRGGDRRAAGALFRAADADDSHDVSAEEWAAFMSGLVLDDAGAVSLDDLAGKLPAPRRGGDGTDTTKRDRALTRAFDRDGDGVVTLNDLQALFDMVDGNADGALDPTELRPRR